MTSKTSSFKFGRLTMHRFKQLTWLTTLWSAGLFFALPVLQSMQLGFLMPQKSYGYGEVNSLIGNDNYLVLIGVFVTGIIAACVVQAFMNSKTQNDLWLSLPVRREKLFAANLTAGGMAVLIPLTAAYVITIIMTVLTPSAYGFEMKFALFGYLRAVGLFLVAYSITTLWCVLSGRTIIAVLCAIFTPAIGVGSLSIVSMFFSLHFKTYYASTAYNNALISLYPFAPFFGNSESLYTIMQIVWTAVAVGLLILAFWLVKRRGAETAGKALAFSKALPVVKYPLILFGMSFGWLLFASTTESLGWSAFGAVAIGLCVFCFVNVLEKFEFRNILHHWWKYGITMAVFGLSMTVLLLDSMSFDTRLPARDNITEAKVYILGLNDTSLNPSKTYGETITDSEVIDTLYKISEFAVSNADKMYSHSEIFGYINLSMDRFVNVSMSQDYMTFAVDYNGFIRIYHLQLDQSQRTELTALLMGSGNQAFITALSGVYDLSPGDVDMMNVNFYDVSYNYMVELAEANGSEGGGWINDIITALRADVLLTSTEKLQNARILGVIEMRNSKGRTYSIPIYDYYESIRETWLWDAINNHALKVDPVLIESIEVERNDNNTSVTYTDPVKISELSSALITDEDVKYNPLVTIATEYTVTVNYKDGRAVIPSLCNEHMPEWLKNS
ncbi:MAG TPA: hypothetical protein PK854_09220 [Oscillospiraceae bacterium]|nr:hypothetical protein [Oscillospiraceae bacterium]HPS35433.1 hypothetical protein [Oscillospiraceae bacterium]